MRTKVIECTAGEWTTIISNFGRGYPQNFTVRVMNVDGTPVNGDYCERRYFWIFPEKPIRGKLSGHMQFRRHWINGIYSVEFRTEKNCHVEVR